MTTVVATANFNRPNDTNGYDPGDVVASSLGEDIITFPNVFTGANSGGVIKNVLMRDSVNQPTPGTFELWLFASQITTSMVDRDPFALNDGQAELVIAVITLSAQYVSNWNGTAGGNRVYQAEDVNIGCVSTGTELYGILVVRNAYSPLGSENFSFRMCVLRDA